MPDNSNEIKAEPRRWFRFYAESVNDPKVQRLAAHLFKTWVNLLCLASANGGTLPSREDIAFQLRMSDHDANSQIDELIGLGLLDIAAGKSLEPHNWKARQFMSDISKDRVRKHRTKKAEASLKPECNVTVTPPDTEQIQITDTETEQKVACATAALPEVSDLKVLSDRLHKVAGPCLASQAIAPGLASMMVPQMWIDQGCDIDRDIVPAVQLVVLKGKKNVKSWDYFTNAVAEAKAKRSAGIPTVDASTAQPRKMTVREALNASIAAREAAERAAP